MVMIASIIHRWFHLPEEFFAADNWGLAEQRPNRLGRHQLKHGPVQRIGTKMSTAPTAGVGRSQIW